MAPPFVEQSDGQQAIHFALDDCPHERSVEFELDLELPTAREVAQRGDKSLDFIQVLKIDVPRDFPRRPRAVDLEIAPNCLDYHVIARCMLRFLLAVHKLWRPDNPLPACRQLVDKRLHVGPDCVVQVRYDGEEQFLRRMAWKNDIGTVP
jgi:hypothetical protein